MEIVARRLDAALPGERIESAMAPGINALKTFDPPLSALEGATITGARRRGKLLLLDVDAPSHGPLTLLLHLMSAGRAQVFDKRASLRDRTSRVLLRLPGDRELRVREFGTKQRAWAKLLTPEASRPRSRSPGSGRRHGRTRPTICASCSRRRGRSTRCCATSGWSPASAARGSTRSCTPRGSRRSSAATTSPRPRPARCARRWSASSSACSTSTRSGRAPAAGEVPEADARARAPGRAVPALRDRARGGVLRGLRDDVLPALPDRGPGAQGPPALAAAEVATTRSQRPSSGSAAERLAAGSTGSRSASERRCRAASDGGEVAAASATDRLLGARRRASAAGRTPARRRPPARAAGRCAPYAHALARSNSAPTGRNVAGAAERSTAVSGSAVDVARADRRSPHEVPAGASILDDRRG